MLCTATLENPVGSCGAVWIIIYFVVSNNLVNNTELQTRSDTPLMKQYAVEEEYLIE